MLKLGSHINSIKVHSIWFGISHKITFFLCYKEILALGQNAMPSKASGVTNDLRPIFFSTVSKRDYYRVNALVNPQISRCENLKMYDF